MAADQGFFAAFIENADDIDVLHAVTKQLHLKSYEVIVGGVQEAIAVYAAKWYRQTEREDKNKQRLYTRMEYYRGIADKRPMQCLFSHPYYWAAFTVNGV